MIPIVEAVVIGFRDLFNGSRWEGRLPTTGKLEISELRVMGDTTTRFRQGWASQEPCRAGGKLERVAEWARGGWAVHG